MDFDQVVLVLMASSFVWDGVADDHAFHLKL